MPPSPKASPQAAKTIFGYQAPVKPKADEAKPDEAKPDEAKATASAPDLPAPADEDDDKTTIDPAPPSAAGPAAKLPPPVSKPVPNPASKTVFGTPAVNRPPGGGSPPSGPGQPAQPPGGAPQPPQAQPPGGAQPPAQPPGGAPQPPQAQPPGGAQPPAQPPGGAPQSPQAQPPGGAQQPPYAQPPGGAPQPPGQPMPGQPMPGQPYPGQPMAGQPYPGQPGAPWGGAMAGGAVPGANVVEKAVAAMRDHQLHQKLLLVAGAAVAIAVVAIPLAKMGSAWAFTWKFSGGTLFRLLIWPLLAAATFLFAALAKPSMRQSMPPWLFSALPFVMAGLSAGIVGWGGVFSFGPSDGIEITVRFGYPILLLGLLLYRSQSGSSLSRGLIATGGILVLIFTISFLVDQMFSFSGKGALLIIHDLLFGLVLLAATAGGAIALSAQVPQLQAVERFAPAITALLLLWIPVQILLVFLAFLVHLSMGVSAVFILIHQTIYTLGFLGVFLALGETGVGGLRSAFASVGQPGHPGAYGQQGYPPQQQGGYPPPQQGYPPQQQGGYPPQQQQPPGYPPQQPGMLQQPPGQPPQAPGQPPQQQPPGPPGQPPGNQGGGWPPGGGQQ